MENKTDTAPTRGGELVPTNAPAYITTQTQYAQQLAAWQRAYNVLTPVVNFSGLAPSFGLIATIVQFDPNPKSAAAECYQDNVFTKGDDVALTKVALRRIAEAAGISIETVRTDPRTIPWYWEVKAKASWRGMDGSVITREATVEYDLRDGSPRLRGFTPAQIQQARVSGLRGAESRAVNAAIREFGIKQKYSKAEVGKPFVVVRAAYIPDMTDPAIRMMVAEKALGGTTNLYAHQLAAGALPQPEALDAFGMLEPAAPGPRQVGASTTTPAAGESTPGTDAPLTVTGVTSKDGQTGDRKWTRYDVAFSDGRVAPTFSTSIATAAEALKGKSVDATITRDEQGRLKLEEIGPAGSSPNLPGMDKL